MDERRGASEAEGRADHESAVPSPAHIVCVGASAGGLAALSDLLRGLPPTFGMAVVVVTHLDPTHESSLPALLARVTDLPVSQVVDRDEPGQGHVYVLPPNTSMVLEGKRLRLSPRSEAPAPAHPIDRFMESLACELAGDGIGVVLSGTGTDGAAGLRAIKAAGGITFAQDGTAQHGDMPRSAVAAGAVDRILPPSSIAEELVRLDASSDAWCTEFTRGGAQNPRVRGLIHRLGRTCGIDFDHYKQNTILRRIGRRIKMLGLEHFADYLVYFDEHDGEADLLCQDILIHVTSFFRDAETFEALGESVFPAIIASRKKDRPVRIWVPACSTGEEVYSLAMHLLSFVERNSLKVPIKIFGTDVSERALIQARSGRYTKASIDGVPADSLRRYFLAESDGYVIRKSVRDLCVFARQDVTKDPPFSRLDLISCRNLLIYLGHALQRRVLPMFHYALREGGYLVLGRAEGVGGAPELFKAIESSRNIFIRSSVPRRLHLDLGDVGLTGLSDSDGALSPWGPVSPVEGIDVQREADRVLLSRFAPPSVLVDESLQILQFRGETSSFLAVPSGSPSHSLLRMAREGLLPGLRALIDEGRRTSRPARREGLRIKADRRTILADIEYVPLRGFESPAGCFLILFHERSSAETVSASAPVEPTNPAGGTHEADRVAELERELVATRDYLSANVERLEVANEELRAANEEVLSSSEEVQSINEELQTSKEELQATNEELLTINDELVHRNEEVKQLSDDLSNLLASVMSPIIMFGRDLRIRRFTPSAATILGLRPTDLGEGPSEVRWKLDMGDLEGPLVKVMDQFTTEEWEVHDREGRWFLARVQPYRTQDNRVDGAVLTLTDIDQLKLMNLYLEEARDTITSVVRMVRDPYLVVESTHRVMLANAAFAAAFDLRLDSIEGRVLGTEVVEPWVTSELLRIIDAVAGGAPEVEEEPMSYRSPKLGQRSLRISARAVPEKRGDAPLVLVMLEDRTDIERELEARANLASKLQEAQRLESMGVLAGGVAHDFNNILTAILGFSELAERGLDREAPSRLHLRRIQENTKIAAELCQQLLAYSGRVSSQVSVLDLRELVRASQPLLAAVVGKQAQFHYELGDDPLPVEGDRSQLRQVLVNLVLNASEALAGAAGTIWISTGRVEPPADDPPSDALVFLQVRDDGQGMSPEILDRVLEPFFTTKTTGRGLGLAVVDGIIRGHHGRVEIASEPGHGCRVWVGLPLANAPLTTEPSEPRIEAPDWHGSGVVLIVDDQAHIRELLIHLLEARGFEVESAENGREALEVLARDPARIDLVLLDLTMPVMSGKEAFLALRRLRGDLPIVMMSGYDRDHVLREFPLDASVGFLSKPFRSCDLEIVIEEALRSR